MIARPTWHGHLRLALVSCPIRLTPGTSESDHIRLNRLNRETGNRLRQQMIDSETGEVVPRDETVMGYEFEKGRYITVEQEELDKLKIESSETVEIERFVERGCVDWMYWDTPYIVEPEGKTGLDIFLTIREAMHRKKVMAIGRTVMARRERPVLVQPCGKGMMLSTLHDESEVRIPKLFFQDIKDEKVNDEYLSMAEQLIDRMKGPFDPGMFEDRYQKALHELVEAKLKGQKLTRPAKSEPPTNIINLADALRASLAKSGAAQPKKSRRKAAPKAAADKAAPRGRKRA